MTQPYRDGLLETFLTELISTLRESAFPRGEALKCEKAETPLLC